MDGRPVRPARWAPVIGAAIPVVGALGLLVAVVRARPILGETALAVDAEGRLGDRVSSALELAVGVPGIGRPGRDRRGRRRRPTEPRRRGRPDAGGRRPTASSAASAPTRWRRCGRSRPTCSGRASRERPAVALVAAASLLAPVLLIPNPQDAVIAQQRQVREAADEQAERLDELAEDLETKGADANDPRTRLAQELRELARQLRERPGRARREPRPARRRSRATSAPRSIRRPSSAPRR